MKEIKFSINAKTQTIVLRGKEHPLALKEYALEIPFAIWKLATAQLLQLEAQQGGQRPLSIDLPSDGTPDASKM